MRSSSLIYLWLSPALPPRGEEEELWGKDLLLLDACTGSVVSLAVSYDDDAVVLHELAILHAVGSHLTDSSGYIDDLEELEVVNAYPVAGTSKQFDTDGHLSLLSEGEGSSDSGSHVGNFSLAFRTEEEETAWLNR